MNLRLTLITTLLICLSMGGSADSWGQKNAFRQWASQRIGNLAELPHDEALAHLKSTLDSLCQRDDNRDYIAFIEQCERDFATPTSQTHNERLYLLALQHIVVQNNVPAFTRMRYEELLKLAQRNAIGTTATDVTLVTADGNEHPLSEFLSTPLNILYFNDPDCDACEIVKSRLDTTALLQDLVAKKQLTIVAIYPFNDEQLWRGTHYPDGIINTWDRNQVIDNDQVYDVPSMPLLYLLDNNRTVILRNEASLNRVLKTIEQLTTEALTE